jgi:hypothetical protein
VARGVTEGDQQGKNAQFIDPTVFAEKVAAADKVVSICPLPTIGANSLPRWLSSEEPMLVRPGRSVPSNCHTSRAAGSK